MNFFHAYDQYVYSEFSLEFLQNNDEKNGHNTIRIFLNFSDIIMKYHQNFPDISANAAGIMTDFSLLF